jgi:GNAT superfamily N-acetyltransferase
MMAGMDVTVVDLEPGDPRMATDLFPVLKHLRPHLDEESLAAVYAEGHPQGYRFTAAYGDGRCVGVAGWRIVATAHALRKLYVDDLVTDPLERSGGVGHALIAELTRKATAAGCSVLDLDSGVHRHDAHRFYFRERMHISSHHFTLPLDGQG